MTPLYLPAATAMVALIVDGSFAPVAPPARLVAGRVVAPAAFVATIAARTAERDGLLEAERDGRRCSVAAWSLEGTPYVTLAPLARCLGATVAWDARARALSLAWPAPNGLHSPAPFDPTAPSVAPTAHFTPEPPPPTPRATATGSPRPRRTAIPVTPSLPLGPPARP